MLRNLAVLGFYFFEATEATCVGHRVKTIISNAVLLEAGTPTLTLLRYTPVHACVHVHVHVSVCTCSILVLFCTPQSYM